MQITKEQLCILIKDIESDLIERTESINNTDKFAQTICAFANDMPAHHKPGYLIIGVKDKGKLTGLTVTDELLKNLSGIRADGNIQPLPRMNVDRVEIEGEGQVAVIEVFPADMPPVRYRGIIWIRVGPCQARASEQEERMLTEKRSSKINHFDGRPCSESVLNDLAIDTFRNDYLPNAVSREVIEENHRELKVQLASLRFYNLLQDCPTYAGIILFGKNSRQCLPGAYVQFLQIDGEQLSDTIINEKEIDGDLLTILRELDLLVTTLIQERPIQDTVLRESIVRDYPEKAVRELLMNAIIHRDYESTAPIRFYWFANRIEIQNPGGLYGEAKEGFYKHATAYRNPIIAEAMKTLGYVNKYGRGILTAQEALKKNENKPADFNIEHSSVFLVTIWKNK
jgi:ATP-dependent DNA helicase RecG